MSWISGDHNSGAERVWASCTLFGNQPEESLALQGPRAAPLPRSPSRRYTRFLGLEQTPCPGSGSALNVCLQYLRRRLIYKSAEDEMNREAQTCGIALGAVSGQALAGSVSRRGP